jgi:transposase-like protein
MPRDFRVERSGSSPKKANKQRPEDRAAVPNRVVGAGVHTDIANTSFEAIAMTHEIEKSVVNPDQCDHQHPTTNTDSITRASPTLYTAELAERILHEVEGGRSLHDVCRDHGVPAYSTVRGWVVRDHEGFAARYIGAREIGHPRRGRAPLYTAEIAERVLRELADGRTLDDVCRDHGMPSYTTVRGWVIGDREGFAARYIGAREIGRPRCGRAPRYTAELAERILQALADGRTLRNVCLDDGMPAASTVQLWVSDDLEGFAARYRRAREAGRCSIRHATLYTAELAERILFELSEGRSLRDICRDDGMPHHSTVRLWAIEDREGFAARYSRAREFGHHDMADEMREIADDGRNDWTLRRRKDGSVEAVFDHENVRRSRLRCDVRRWLLSSALPKIYGNRVEVDTKYDANHAMAEMMKLIDGKTRGLPSEDEPLDKAELDRVLARFPE